jgi:hypothetical protein
VQAGCSAWVGCAWVEEDEEEEEEEGGARGSPDLRAKKKPA